MKQAWRHCARHLRATSSVELHCEEVAAKTGTYYRLYRTQCYLANSRPYIKTLWWKCSEHMSKILGGGGGSFSGNYHKTDRKIVIIAMGIWLHLGTVSEPYQMGNLWLNSEWHLTVCFSPLVMAAQLCLQTRIQSAHRDCANHDSTVAAHTFVILLT
jgi:hypothetical protein